MTELPLVVVNSQRGGPSTGLPTKTEQSDLYQAVYGRNGDAPLPVLAARSPSDCFEVRDRGLPHRGAVHDAGVPADRRLYRQRGRAVEGPDAMRIAKPFPVKFLDRGRGLPSLCATNAGARLGKPGTPGLSTASAASRRSSTPAISRYDPRTTRR
jgi:2-oxoglutarate ferredoxin oxidoreductase subunit alpha